jgi:hypothetical protein
MGDSDDDGAVADAGRTPVRVIHAAKTMLPKLRFILVAMIATCAAALTLSAGMLGTRDPANNLSGVPDISRTLMRQAAVEEPEWRQSQLLAYSRRADELMRLRDLPVTPVRAVVEYAEQAQARAAESAGAPAVPATTAVATAATDAAAAPAPAAPASEPSPTIVATAPVATPPADAPSAPAADRGAIVVTPSADTSSPATVAVAPVANPPANTSTATPVASPTAAVSPADTPPETAVANAPLAAPPADTASATAIVSAPVSLPAVEAPAAAPPADTAAVTAPAPAASGDTQVAAVQTGGSETAEMYGPEQPKAAAKKRHGPKAVHAHPTKPKKKPQVGPTTRSVTPTATTGFPVDQRNRSSNALGGWRSNESTAR